MVTVYLTATPFLSLGLFFKNNDFYKKYLFFKTIKNNFLLNYAKKLARSLSLCSKLHLNKVRAIPTLINYTA